MLIKPGTWVSELTNELENTQNANKEKEIYLGKSMNLRTESLKRIIK